MLKGNPRKGRHSLRTFQALNFLLHWSASFKVIMFKTIKYANAILVSVSPMARCINGFRIVLGWTHKWMLIKLINHTLYGGLFPKNDLSLSFYTRIVMTYAIHSIHVLKQHLSWSVGQCFFLTGTHRCLNCSIILLF